MQFKFFLAAAALATSACTQTTDSCVARGSRVKTPDGWKPIEDLEVGDLVFSVNEETGEMVATEIVAIRSAMREVGSMSIGETTLRLTSDHPVFDPTAGSYAPAGDWFLGDRTALSVLDGTLQTRSVDAVSSFVETTEVFDIEVASEFHNFIAEGIVVHNKSIADGCNDANGDYRVVGEVCEIEGCVEAVYVCTVGDNTRLAVCECQDTMGIDVGTD